LTLNRPAILTELTPISDGLIGTFGAYDSVLFEIIFAQFSPQGKLPFEIPSSMAAVTAQKKTCLVALRHLCLNLAMD
jgi:beta-glucosidase